MSHIVTSTYHRTMQNNSVVITTKRRNTVPASRLHFPPALNVAKNPPKKNLPCFTCCFAVFRPYTTKKVLTPYRYGDIMASSQTESGANSTPHKQGEKKGLGTPCKAWYNEAIAEQRTSRNSGQAPTAPDVLTRRHDTKNSRRSPPTKSQRHRH